MTKTMRVFRIEDWSGQGPFRGPFSQAMNDAMTTDPDEDWHGKRFPGSHESFAMLSRGHVCGTSSPRDLVRWFPRPIRMVLARHGFGLSVYELPVDAVVTSDVDRSQVMFQPVREVDSAWRDFAHQPSFAHPAPDCGIPIAFVM